jgi:Putative prokaryotic signal transducing protein
MPTMIDRPPPGLLEDLGGSGGSGWTVLIKARHDIDAHLLSGRLAEAGIESRALKDVSAPGAWMYGGSNPWAPVSILVKKLDLDDARVVLAEISYEGPTADQLATQASERHRSFPVVWWVTAILLGAALSVLVVSQVTRWSGMPCQLPALCEGSP